MNNEKQMMKTIKALQAKVKKQQADVDDALLVIQMMTDILREQNQKFRKLKAKKCEI